jgi:uncharacterized protein (TIGR02679 family)
VTGRSTESAAERQLLSWARSPGASLLLAEARRRWEAGHRGDRVRLAVSPTPDQRRDVGRLLGLEWVTSGQAVTLGQLRAAIGRAAPGWDMRDLLTAIGGELRDKRAEKVQLADLRAGRREQLISSLTLAGVSAGVAELAVARRWLGGADDPAAVQRAEAVAAVLIALPSRAGRLLASLASELFGDPHALDRISILGRATARVLASEKAAAAGADSRAAADAVAMAAGWREAWEAAGIACDQVSSTVLVLNLPLPGTGVLPALTMAAAQAGEPLWLTARMLRPDWTLQPESLKNLAVRVCENPSVVEAAADIHGPGCPPLVCTYGRPAGAAWTLLHALAVAGARIAVSADRDDAGRGIMRDLIAGLPGAEAWLPKANGLYEEDRLADLLDDLGCARPADAMAAQR